MKANAAITFARLLGDFVYLGGAVDAQGPSSAHTHLVPENKSSNPSIPFVSALLASSFSPEKEKRATAK